MTYSDSGSTAGRKTYSQLSPAIVYYIRKLLRQNLDRLKFVVAPGAGLRADHLSDLNVVIQSLYLEESQVETVVLDLERFSLSHQALSGQASLHRQELIKLEDRIFWLLGFKQQAVKQSGRILIVDDNPENLRLLSIALSQQGYDVRSAMSGLTALGGLRSIMPDLILLDIMMSGINGYQVCEQIKADTLTQDIPIIFISAISETVDKVKAFRLGGVDFITKPFQIEEVLLRIAHQLSIRSLKKRLEEQNVRLQQELRDREQIFQEREEAEAKAIEATRQQMQAQLDQTQQTIERLTAHLPSKNISERVIAGEIVADRAESTILFANLVNFTAFSAEATPVQVIRTISQIFSVFDCLVEQYGVTKIKTIGTTYIAVGGLPEPRADQARAIADLALAMQQALLDYPNPSTVPLRLRVGIHTGTAIGGTVGTQPAYDLWGDTVDMTNQIQSECAPGRILVTATTGTALRSHYLLEPRGNLFLGNVEVMTYWLVSRKRLELTLG